MNLRTKLKLALHGCAVVFCTLVLIRYPHWDVFWILEFLAVIILAYSLYIAKTDARAEPGRGY